MGALTDAGIQPVKYRRGLVHLTAPTSKKRKYVKTLCGKSTTAANLVMLDTKVECDACLEALAKFLGDLQRAELKRAAERERREREAPSRAAHEAAVALLKPPPEFQMMLHLLKQNTRMLEQTAHVLELLTEALVAGKGSK
jgi:hypothetical protein